MNNMNGIIDFRTPNMNAKRAPEQFAKWMNRLADSQVRARFFHERGSFAPAHATREQIIEAVCYGKVL